MLRGAGRSGRGARARAAAPYRQTLLVESIAAARAGGRAVPPPRGDGDHHRAAPTTGDHHRAAATAAAAAAQRGRPRLPTLNPAMGTWSPASPPPPPRMRSAAVAAELRYEERARHPWTIIASLSNERHPHTALLELGYHVVARGTAEGVRQNTPEWLAARRECFFTASEGGRLVTDAPRGALHYENTDPEFRTFKGSAATERGHLVETYVRNALRGLEAMPTDPREPPVQLEMVEGGFTWIEVLRKRGPDVATLWRHPRTGEPWPMRVGASVDVRVFAAAAELDGGVRRERVEVACGELKVPFYRMYDHDTAHGMPVFHLDGAHMLVDTYGGRKARSAFVDPALCAKPAYLLQMVAQMAVMGLPAAVHGVFFPGDPAHPEARTGYMTASTLMFSPVLFDLLVTAAAYIRYIREMMSRDALRSALHARPPYSAAKRDFDNAAAAVAAPAPPSGGWRVHMAFEGEYAWPISPALWERAAREVRGAPLSALLGHTRTQVSAQLAQTAGLPAEACALARHPPCHLYLPAVLRLWGGWPRMDARFRAHIKRLHALEQSDPDFWRTTTTEWLLPPPPRTGDGLPNEGEPWVDSEPESEGDAAAESEAEGAGEHA